MTNAIICNNCEAYNDSGARFCLSCGDALPRPTPKEPQQRQQEWSATSMASDSAPINRTAANAPSRQVERTRAQEQTPRSTSYAAGNYAAMRGLAELCRTVSNLFVVLAVLGGLAGLGLFSESMTLGFAMIVVSIAFGAFNYIIFRLLGESISVIIDIEANTRRTAQLLETWKSGY